MNEPVKKLFELYKPKLSLTADLKIRFRLYSMILISRAKNIGFAFVSDMRQARFAMAIVLFMAVIITSTSFYAYVSAKVLPGDNLYPLKKTVENAESLLSLSDASRVKTYNKLSSRRLEEALIIASDNKPVEKIDRRQKIKANIDEALDRAKEAATISKNIANNTSVQKNKVEMIASGNKNIEVLDIIEKKILEQETGKTTVASSAIKYEDREYKSDDGEDDVVKKINEAKETIREEYGLDEDHDEKYERSDRNEKDSDSD